MNRFKRHKLGLYIECAHPGLQEVRVSTRRLRVSPWFSSKGPWFLEVLLDQCFSLPFSLDVFHAFIIDARLRFPLSSPPYCSHFIFTISHKSDIHIIIFSLRNLPHRPRQFGQHTGVAQHGQTCHGSMGSVGLEKRVQGPITLQIAVVYVGNAHDHLGT